MNGHWKKQFNYDYLGSYSLDGKKEVVVSIKGVGTAKVTGQAGRKEDCFVDKKPSETKMTETIYKSMLMAIEQGKVAQVEMAIPKYKMNKEMSTVILEQIKLAKG